MELWLSGLNRKFVDIGRWKRRISQSHYESADIFYQCDENRTTPLGEFEKLQVCHYSNLNFSIQNSIIVGYNAKKIRFSSEYQV